MITQLYVRVVMVGVNILMCWRRESLLPCLYLPKAFGFLGGRPGFFKGCEVCTHLQDAQPAYTWCMYIHTYIAFILYTEQLSSL